MRRVERCHCGVPIMSARHRALELDAVAFGIVQVDRWALAFGAVARGLRAAIDSVRGEMLGDRAGIERLDAQAEVIEIGAAGRRGALRWSGLAGGNDVDQRAAGAQLRQRSEE